MMERVVIKVNENLNFEFVTYDNGNGDAHVNYIEHATDHWSVDSETSVDVSFEKLTELYKAIGEFLEL